MEEIQWFIENPNFCDHQRTLVCARVFGELYWAEEIDGESPEEERDEDEEPFNEENVVDEDAAEQFYLRQLQDEALRAN